jgi:putative sterol carrier protein
LGKRAFTSQVTVSGQAGIAETSRLRYKPQPRPAPAAPEPTPTPTPTPSPGEASSVGEVLTVIASRLDGKRPEATTTLKFDIDGEGIYRLVIKAGACRLERGDGEAETTLRMNAKNGVKILTGKMNPMMAMATGKLKIEGNMQGAMILQSAR